MTHNRVLAICLLAACVLAGCGTKSAASAHPSASAAVSSAAAHVKSLATSPVVQAKVRQIAPKVVSCAQAQGVKLAITGAGTDSMTASVAHISGTAMLHPVTSVEAMGRCLGLTAADVAKLKSYTQAQVLANGFGKGSGTKDFTNIVNYLAGLITGQAS
jgi:hypothetical protein